MNRILTFSAVCALMCAMAGEGRADWFGLTDSKKDDAAAAKVAASPVSGGQVMKAARVRWLDKQTNRVQELVFTSGTTQNPGGVSVAMTKCIADYGGVPGQDVAWLEVRENGRGAPWFAGWMFNTFPEVATLDHPRYDMALVGCGDKPRARALVPVKPNEVSSDKVLGGDSEAPGADTESKADPYYVPGVEKPSAETPAPEGAAPAVAPANEPTAAVPGMATGTAASAASPAPAAQQQPAAQPMAAPANVSDPEALQQLMDQR